MRFHRQQQASHEQSPDESQRRIREGVKRGLDRRQQIRPYRLQRPIKLEIAFKDQVKAELIAYLPGVDRPKGNTILLSTKDMIETARYMQVFDFINIPIGVQ